MQQERTARRRVLCVACVRGIKQRNIAKEGGRRRRVEGISLYDDCKSVRRPFSVSLSFCALFHSRV